MDRHPFPGRHRRPHPQPEAHEVRHRRVEADAAVGLAAVQIERHARGGDVGVENRDHRVGPEGQMRQDRMRVDPRAEASGSDVMLFSVVLGSARLPSSRSRSSSEPGSSPTSRNLATQLARGLLLLDLLGEEPLQLGHLGERLVLEAELVERIDLGGDAFFLPQRGLEHLGERIELAGRLRDLQQLDDAVARVHEIEELHAVSVLFGALRLQPIRGADEFLALTERGHRQVLVPGGELRVDLHVNRVKHVRMHRVAPPN